MKNRIKIEIGASLRNQGLARAFAAAYASEADPTVEELTEIKTAVSEAFSNAVIHGYKNCGGCDDKEAASELSEVFDTEAASGLSEVFDTEAAPEAASESTPEADNYVTMELGMLCKDTLMIKISDEGAGIENVAEAMEPLFTTHDGEECSGMGFTVMESFTDKLTVESEKGRGTTVTMIKKLDTYYGL